MTIASDNPFPSLLIVEGTEPTAPAAGRQRLYIDSTTHLLKLTNSSGTDTNVGAAGTELDYVQITSPVSITATVEASATTVVTGSSVTYDGSTIVLIEFYAPYLFVSSAAVGNFIVLSLWEDSTEIGHLGTVVKETTADLYVPGGIMARRRTPSAGSHTYSVRAHKLGTATVAAGAGTTTTEGPAFIRITRV